MTAIKSVGAFAAKTHFSALLEQVQAGESFVITKRGEPVAQLVPLAGTRPSQTLDELRTQAAQLRAQVRIEAGEIRGWINEGRQ